MLILIAYALMLALCIGLMAGASIVSAGTGRRESDRG